MNENSLLQQPHSPPGVAGQALRTPRAAAIAGIIFAVLFATSIGLMRLTIPEEMGGAATNAWLQGGAAAVRYALLLVPFSGIAFLWFMGVVRNQIGHLEDQFFSTVFYGSGLLFLSMMFCSAAIAGGLLSGYAIDPIAMSDSGITTFARTIMYTITNVYAIRMAGVFMLSLGTIWWRTKIMPRPFVVITYLLAAFLLVAINLSLWVIMVFPAWVLAISLYILAASLRGKTRQAARQFFGRNLCLCCEHLPAASSGAPQWSSACSPAPPALHPNRRQPATLQQLLTQPVTRLPATPLPATRLPFWKPIARLAATS